MTLAFNHIRAERGDQYPVTLGRSKFVDGSQDGLKDIAWTDKRIELILTEMGNWPEEPFRKRSEMRLQSSTL